MVRDAAGWALLAAVAGALGLVLQQRGATAAPDADEDAGGFVAALVHDPFWLAGGLRQLGCWLCQGLALRDGALVLVQPIAASNAACPVSSVALGRVVFLETPARTAAGTVASLASLGGLLAGLVLLARGEASRELSAGVGSSTSHPAAP